MKPDNKLQTGRVATGIRSLYILEVLVKAGAPLTPTEINEILKLPKPTIHRLCQRLESERFLEKDIDGRHYLPGARLRTIAFGALGFSNYTQARHAVLQHLSEQIGETCNITIPGSAGMQYLDRVETRWPLRVHFPVGEQVPFHCTASGKLYLSSLHKSQRRQLVDSLTLSKQAENTLTDRDQLLAALAHAQQLREAAVKIREAFLGNRGQV